MELYNRNSQNISLLYFYEKNVCFFFIIGGKSSSCTCSFKNIGRCLSSILKLVIKMTQLVLYFSGIRWDIFKSFAVFVKSKVTSDHSNFKLFQLEVKTAIPYNAITFVSSVSTKFSLLFCYLKMLNSYITYIFFLIVTKTLYISCTKKVRGETFFEKNGLTKGPNELF